MRAGVGGLIAIVAFAGILVVGGNALGVWDPLRPNEQIGIQAPRAQDAKFKAPRPSAGAKRKRGTHPSADPDPPRERLRRKDMKSARRAVLHQGDMNGDGWVRIRPSPEESPHRCATYNPDLSKFTITGDARSAFRGGDSYIESRAALFPNVREAERFFEARFNPRALPCIRDAIKRALLEAGLRPRVRSADYNPAPNVGEQTMVYVIEYVVTARGKRFLYPVDVIAFRRGRSVGSVWFAMIPSADGSRPCECEFYEARKVEARLQGS
jgi:hypothetical protein